MKETSSSFLKDFKDNLNGTSTFLASCQQYYDNGERNNGTFRIRPNIALPSFEVYCAFDNTSVFTEIEPLNWPENGLIFPKNESVRCYEPNCFTEEVRYEPTIDQIKVNTVLNTYIPFYI